MNIWSIIIRTWTITAILAIVAENAWNVYVVKRLLKDDPWNGPKTVREFLREFHETFFSKGGLMMAALLTLSFLFNYIAWPYMVYQYLKNPMFAIEAFTEDMDANEKEDEP